MSEGVYDPTAGKGPLDPWVLGEIRNFLEDNPPRSTIQRITGRSLVPADPVYVVTEEATNSLAYVALATPVEIKLLPAGKYIFFFGHTVSLDSGAGPAARAKAGLSINGGAVDDNTAISTGGIVPVGGSMVAMVTLEGDNNTVAVQYSVSNNLYAGNYGRRYLACIRYSD